MSTTKVCCYKKTVETGYRLYCCYSKFLNPIKIWKPSGKVVNAMDYGLCIMVVVNFRML